MSNLMVRAIATSRCEVAGVPYNPGDAMLLTEEQFSFLEGKGAARRENLQSVGSAMTEALVQQHNEAAGASSDGKQKREAKK